MAQVHRFHDRVAISLSGKNKETRYLSPDSAEHIGRALIAAAASIRAVDFVNSTVGTVNAPDEELNP